MWLTLGCLFLIGYGEIIISDNMDTLDSWTIIGNSFGDINERNDNKRCSSDICSYISEHTTIYKSFNISGYSNIIIKYSIDIGRNEAIRCGNNRCDYFYVFYQCGYVKHMLYMYDYNSNGHFNEELSLGNVCDGSDELIIYFHSAIYGLNKKVYIDDLKIKGIIGVNTAIMDELIYENKLDNTDTFVYHNGDVNIYDDGKYCIPNNCAQITQSLSASSDFSDIMVLNINVSGYDNISVYYDVNIAPQNNLDDDHSFTVAVSCDRDDFRVVKVYGTSNGAVDPSVSRYYVGERFDLPKDFCVNVNRIDIMFELVHGLGKTIYIGNVHVFGTNTNRKFSNRTTTDGPTTTIITTTPIITTPHSTTLDPTINYNISANASIADNYTERPITVLNILYIFAATVLLICIIGCIYQCIKLRYGYKSRLSKSNCKTPGVISQPSSVNNPVINLANHINTKSGELNELPQQPKIRKKNETIGEDISITISDDIEIITSPN